MPEIFNRKQTKNLRRILRSQSISAEHLLWRKLRKKQLGFRFNRQYGIGRYIVDFYCASKRLVIEADGATHCTKEELEKDRIREEYLKSLGLTIKRYANGGIHNNLGLVVTDIFELLNGEVK